MSTEKHINAPLRLCVCVCVQNVSRSEKPFSPDARSISERVYSYKPFRTQHNTAESLKSASTSLKAIG